jgi:perosamine synthetase
MCAIGASLLGRRQEIFAAYRNLLDGIPGIEFQPVAPWAETAPWLFCITVDERAYGPTRDELIALLAQKNIETRPFFVPLHTLPPFREEWARCKRELPFTEHVAARGMNLPTFTALANSQIEEIAFEIRRCQR